MASSSFLVLVCVLLIAGVEQCMAKGIQLGSRLTVRDNETWISNNRTFAFGFSPMDSGNQFQLAVWYNELPGDRVVVWSANRNSPVGKDGIVELDKSGNLVLVDGNNIVWTSNTSDSGVHNAEMSDSGNFVLYDSFLWPVWQSFSHPTDTLLPGQNLTVSLELTSSNSSPSHGGFYTLKMLQERTSLSLALTYNLPQSYNGSQATESNYSYWSGPEVSNVTGNVFAVLDESGNFGIVYGESSDGTVFVYKSEADASRSNQRLVLRRLTLEQNGNLRLYRWDDDVNGSRQWVPEWAAVSKPCDIAGVCGTGICNLDGSRSKSNASCNCLPGTQCLQNSSLRLKCDKQQENSTSQFKIATISQTNYYFSESSVLENYTGISTISKCGDICLSDCQCVASVYGLKEEKPYCWILKNLEFGGYEDPGSTLFVKVGKNVSITSGRDPRKSGRSSGQSDSTRNKVVIIPIVLCMLTLIGFLCVLLYYTVHRRRSLKRDMERSLTVSGAPLNFSYRHLESATNNFTQLLGSGGFGSVYKGSIGDGTLIAVKKLERVLPHGEKEFITEVNTIGSMHHMNLVRLCGFCSEGTKRLLVYEYMKNGSLDKWIFPSYSGRETTDRILDWKTRFLIATETAQGIAYFHEQCRNRIIHCDIKPENILLDDNFHPKVSDFGLAKLMGREHSRVVTMIRGTRGYLAPEWISNRPITVKADVYSYGMLLLEIIGGRRNLDMSLDPARFYYPGWAFKEMGSETPKRVADKRLNEMVKEDELVRTLKVAFWCIQDEAWMRPSMGEVVKMLEGSVDINQPPMPQAVSELIAEGLDHVYKAMKREFNHCSSNIFTSGPSSSLATYSDSTMSPR
ncbi:hypothetical protein MKW94_021359 [Papaver nudicaule]|uniref:Receptor-like serine/threonine-protein kinase n=1 Tax=Papaver nudicaule TaxID=74823 RepID=A0AA41SD26_PAPNU|nr:hypothetical protein [Papaver nudicaule]